MFIRYVIIINIFVGYISAHGFLSQPAAIYVGPEKTSFIHAVDGNKIFPGVKWNDTPLSNTNQLIKKINDGSFPNLKTFFSNYIHGCPKNDINDTISVNGLNSFKWQNDKYREGFINSHEGPCEVWIDSKKIFSDNNCARKYTAYPAEVSINYSSCVGTCQFEFYWLAMHEYMWQMYKACVKITGVSPNPCGCSQRFSNSTH